MNKKILGRLINYERNKKNISLQQLADGVCSASALQRLEHGERLPDFFVLERLLERLGKSVNKMEFLYNETDYEIYYLREIVEKYLEQGDYIEVSNALAYYGSLPEAEKGLHRQYILKMQAVVLSEKEQNHEKAQTLFKNALEETTGNFSLCDLDKCLLGEGELVLLLLWIWEKTETEGFPVQAEGRRILHYIERICRDEEVRANVYSKAVWVLGTVAIRQGNFQEALRYTLQGEKILTDNGLLLHLPQFLERILFLTKERDESTYIEWKKQRDALKQLYEEYGQVWETENIGLWKNYRQSEVYLISELFGQERKLVKHSQEKLADVLEIDQKTISRIESGKCKPKAGTFRKMKEYLQIDRDICTTRIVVEDFYLLELEREIAWLNHHHREAEAEELYQQLKEKLSLKWKENQQYIKYMDVLFAKELGRITAEEAIEGCMEALRVTRSNLKLIQVDEVVLSRMETFIINYIARCYGQLDRKKEAIIVLEKIVNGFKNSKVDLKYHYVAVALICQHLCFNYEECNCFDKAYECCDETIRFELECKKGLNLGIVLGQKIYTLDRKCGDRSASKKKYLQAYQLLKLMNKRQQMENLQEFYYEWYGEDIDK